MEGNFSGPVWGTASSAPTGSGEEAGNSITLPGPTKLLRMNQRREMYPKEQWLALKPIIEQLYVNKCQTFNKVAEYMAEHHNFHPTKKQFMRRISEWGFEKNVKRDERRAILERLAIEANADVFQVTMLRGRRLDKAKIERWRKREGLGGDVSETGLTHPSGNSNGTPSLSIGYYSQSSKMELCGQDETPEGLPLHGGVVELIPVAQQSTFNPWLLVDIVGSPRFTRLIGALTLDLCEDIPSLDLTAPFSEESEDDYDLIYADEAGRSVIPGGSRNPSLSPKKTFPSVSYSIAALSTRFSKQSQRWTPGPLDELYPFPTSVQSRRLFPSPKVDHLNSEYSLRMKGLDCKRRFQKLKSMERSEIIDLVDDMRSVAWRHYEQHQFRQAETWWRRLITSCLEMPGHQPYQVLHACLLIVESIRFQGRPIEALSLHQAIHHKIVKLFGPDHKLALNSKDKLGRLMHAFGDYDSPIAICRELLQYSLLHFGLRSRDTLDHLQRLGHVLVSSGQYDEAEAIICLAVELGCELNNCIKGDMLDYEASIRAMIGLARCLNLQRRYEDCKRVLNAAEDHFQDPVKFENSFYWGHFIEKADVLKNEGRLSEAEEILQAVLRHAPDHPDVDIVVVMDGLGNIFTATGRQAEAATFFERSFTMGVEIYGIEHKYSRYDCEYLGFFYANQRRYDDAIIHFQQTIEKLTLIIGGDVESRNVYIETIQGWISEVEGMKERHGRWSSEISSIEDSSFKDSSVEDWSIQDQGNEDSSTENSTCS